MNSEHLRKKLIAAARALPADQEAPFCFEKRIIANLPPAFRPDLAGWLAHTLLKPAAFFVGVMMLTGVWTFVHPAPSTADNEVPEIENAIWAPLDSLSEAV
jgi:hypothetical protein